MERQGAIKWAKEIKAFQEGKDIEVSYNDGDGYCDTDTPGFHTQYIYRVKPAKKIDVATDRLIKSLEGCGMVDTFEKHARVILKGVYGDE